MNWWTLIFVALLPNSHFWCPFYNVSILQWTWPTVETSHHELVYGCFWLIEAHHIPPHFMAESLDENVDTPWFDQTSGNQTWQWKILILMEVSIGKSPISIVHSPLIMYSDIDIDIDTDIQALHGWTRSSSQPPMTKIRRWLVTAAAAQRSRLRRGNSWGETRCHRCHQTWQAGRSPINGGFNGQSPIFIVYLPLPCLSTGWYFYVDNSWSMILDVCERLAPLI